MRNNYIHDLTIAMDMESTSDIRGGMAGSAGDVSITGNLFERCGLDFNLSIFSDKQFVFKNFDISNNTCLYTGYAPNNVEWFSPGGDTTFYGAIAFLQGKTSIQNLAISNNVFYTAKHCLITGITGNYLADGGVHLGMNMGSSLGSNSVFSGNVYVQYKNALLGDLWGEAADSGEEYAEDYVRKVLGDRTGTVIYAK